MNCTTTVRGMKLRTRTNRRYVVVFVRPEPWSWREGGDVYPPSIEIERRTDNYNTAKAHVRRHGFGGRVIVDTTTGEEV